jgi:RND family efflux transporter MFP subunit
MKKKIIWAAIVLLVIFGGYNLLKPKPATTVYTTADVVRGDLAQTVSVTGNATPNQQIDMSFKTTGILKSINVDVGDPVTKGQKLASLDPGSQLSQLKEAQIQVKYQQALLDNMKKHRLTFTTDQRNAQKEQVKQAQAAVNVISDQLKDVDIISPITGIVIKRNADPGETVVLNLNSPIVTVAKKDDLLIFSNVPESDILKVQIGQKADITFDALTAQDVLPATVAEIDPASTVIQDVVYYRIKLKLADLDQRIKAGMTANIDVRTAEKSGVLMIPLRAVITEGGQKYVQILIDAKTNQIEKRKVETGLNGDEGMVEIISGLKAGEKVVTFTKTQ